MSKKITVGEIPNLIIDVEDNEMLYSGQISFPLKGEPNVKRLVGLITKEGNKYYPKLILTPGDVVNLGEYDTTSEAREIILKQEILESILNEQ
jgi:hypothetical protein